MAPPCGATAIPYEVFVDVRTEEDLYDLRVSGQISERTFVALLLLYQTKVDLNRADREALYALPNLDFVTVDQILAYRDAAGNIASLGDLVASGAIDARLAESIAAFVTAEPLGPRPPPHGFARVQTRWSGRYDRLPPAAATQARVRAVRHLDAGIVGVLLRNDVRGVRWDVTRQALSVERERVRFVVPKAYVEWDALKWEAVVGTYRIGFGQRLTFDVTDRVTPNGFFGDYELRRSSDLGLRCRRSAGELAETPCPQDVVPRVTPDYQWTNRLAGASVGARQLEVGPGWFQIYGWGSYQVHRVLQTELVDTATCEDPRSDDAPGCGSPVVYERGGDTGAPASARRFTTLPGVVSEALGGANVSYFFGPRAHVGTTGYASFPRWRVDGVELDFQESARRPFGGPFGAIGIDAAYGFGAQDFFVEVARSVDSQRGGGGGFAAIARSVTNLPTTAVDIALRYYAPRYANPYARPVSAPDELDGLRARDEAGVRIRTTSEFGRRVELRTLADIWRRPSRPGLRGTIFARFDLRLSHAITGASWISYRNTGTQSVSWASRIVLEPIARLRIALQYQHEWVDLDAGPSSRQDIAALAHITARPLDQLRLRARVRYDFEDITDNGRLAQVWWAYVEVAITVCEDDTLRARYDFRAFVDERASTLLRAPNPEHWLSVEYVIRF